MQSSNNKSEQKQKSDENKPILNYKEGGILLLTNVVVIFLFSLVYYSMGDIDQWNGVDVNSNLFDFFYFSFTTMTTIGYGDISPKVYKTKIVCIFQQLIVLFELANFFSKVIIQKPLKIKIRKRKMSKLVPTIGEKIGRQRRFNSCQLDYKKTSDLINRRINIEEDDNEVRITLPMPPTGF